MGRGVGQEGPCPPFSGVDRSAGTAPADGSVKEWERSHKRLDGYHLGASPSRWGPTPLLEIIRKCLDIGPKKAPHLGEPTLGAPFWPHQHGTAQRRFPTHVVASKACAKLEPGMG